VDPLVLGWMRHRLCRAGYRTECALTDFSTPDPNSRPTPATPSPGPAGSVMPGVVGQPADAAATARAGASRLGLVAIGVALAALVLAAGSALFAWRAIDQAHDAKDIAIGRAGRLPTDPGSGSTVPGETPTGVQSAVAGPSDVAPVTSPGTPPTLNPRTAFQADYEKQTLVLRTADSSCSSGMYVDLDEPRANVASAGYDIALLDCNDQLKFSLGSGVRGTDAGAPTMTPQECTDRIRTNPIPHETLIPARKGLTMCVNTSFQKAQDEGIPWRMVLIDTGLGESVTVQLTAWRIPG
jgi:hypothetical protein